ncbi:MAG: phosphoethanolamine transferase [Steroidobacteraceae bacterium]
MKFPRWHLSSTWLTVTCALWCLLALNLPFWSRVFEVRPPADVSDIVYLLSLALLALIVIILFLLPLTLWRALTKPVLVIVLLLGAAASYFVSTYGVFIDKVMIRNVFATDTREAGELLNASLIFYLTIFGILPSLVVARTQVSTIGWRRELAQRAAVLGLSLLGVGGIAAGFYQDHASMLRNHRELRHLLVPVNYLAGLSGFLREATRRERPYELVGVDAELGPAWKTPSAEKPLLFVFVIGETMRTQQLALHGYPRDTDPQLAKIPELIDFTNVSSCGTSTAISVPCLFSDLGRAGFDAERARSRDNLLNVLDRVGFNLLWFGNNTNCKGVCRGVEERRVPRERYPDACIAEHPCHDGAMFEEFFAALPAMKGRQVAVLHMLGGHGPGYHLRYPLEFERFTPVCRETDFSKCSIGEVVNAYDNTVVYTDHLLAETIRRLRDLSKQADVALLYVSDHGESLGENGIFLHALPYAIAPEVQTRVPLLLWGSAGFFDRVGIDSDCVKQHRDAVVSHDYLFHSILGLLDVQTSARTPALDLFEGCRDRN